MGGDPGLAVMATGLTQVPGVLAVVLGGSRGRGTDDVHSDVDLGLYYRPPLDLEALRAFAREVAGPGAELAEPGAWGPWVDGGGWLTVDGQAVDWIYRDLDRVHTAWADARAGRFTLDFQVGHPFGVANTGYAGELALGRVLADPTGEVARLQADTCTLPAALRRTVVARALFEIGFSLDTAAKAAARADTTYVSGCLFRVVTWCAYALHVAAGAWVSNEKGLVSACARLPDVPPDFVERAHDLLATAGRTSAELEGTLQAARRLADEVGRVLPDA